MGPTHKCVIITGHNEVVAKVMFLQVSVILSTEGGSASVHVGIPPPKRQTPPRRQTPQEAGSGIWSMSGRYASYWDAFLFCNFLAENYMKMKEFGPPGGHASLAPPLDPPMFSAINLS